MKTKHWVAVVAAYIGLMGAVFSVRQSAPTDLSDIRRNLGEVVEGMREVRGFIFTHVENHDVALSDGPEMRYPRRPAGEPAEVAAVHGEHGAVPAVVSPPGNRSPDQPAGFGGQGFGGAQLRAAAAYGSNPPTAHRALAPYRIGQEPGVDGGRAYGVTAGDLFQLYPDGIVSRVSQQLAELDDPDVRWPPSSATTWPRSSTK